MQEYDVIFKLLLQHFAGRSWANILGAPIVKWLPTELPKFQNTRADLLGEMADGTLVQLELQSTNDRQMALRMAEYCLGIYRQHGCFPRQIVVYIGLRPMRMERRLASPNFSFECEMIDFRNLDGDGMLESPKTSDNVMAVLARLRNQRAAVKTIVERIAAARVEERPFYLEALLTLAGLRGLAKMVEEEISKMPLEINILENEVLGREYRRGEQKGRDEGWQGGRQNGKLELLRRQLAKRFGTLPEWAAETLASASSEELDEFADRMLDTKSLDEVFRHTS